MLYRLRLHQCETINDLQNVFNLLSLFGKIDASCMICKAGEKRFHVEQCSPGAGFSRSSVNQYRYKIDWVTTIPMRSDEIYVLYFLSYPESSIDQTHMAISLRKIPPLGTIRSHIFAENTEVIAET